MKARIQQPTSSALPRTPYSASWFSKLEAGFKETKPVRLTAGEAAAVYQALRNCGVTTEFASNYSAGIGCDTSWQNDEMTSPEPKPKNV